MSPESWPPRPEPSRGSDAELLLRGDQMMADAWRSMARARSGSRFESFEEFFVFSYPLRSGTRNQVRITRAPSDPKRILERAASYFEGATPRWGLACRQEWKPLLDAPCTAIGLVPTADVAVMALSSGLDAPAPRVAGLVVRRVQDAPTLGRFVKIWSVGSQLPESSPETDFWESPPLLDDPNWDFLLGSLDDQPVATGVGYTSRGITGMWGVATLPEFRGRGIGAAMSWAVVNGGARRKADAARLSATELGFPVYRKMGFRHVENEPHWIHG